MPRRRGASDGCAVRATAGCGEHRVRRRACPGSRRRLRRPGPRSGRRGRCAAFARRPRELGHRASLIRVRRSSRFSVAPRPSQHAPRPGLPDLDRLRSGATGQRASLARDTAARRPGRSSSAARDQLAIRRRSWAGLALAVRRRRMGLRLTTAPRASSSPLLCVGACPRRAARSLAQLGGGLAGRRGSRKRGLPALAPRAALGSYGQKEVDSASEPALELDRAARALWRHRFATMSRALPATCLTSP